MTKLFEWYTIQLVPSSKSCCMLTYNFHLSGFCVVPDFSKVHLVGPVPAISIQASRWLKTNHWPPIIGCKRWFTCAKKWKFSVRCVKGMHTKWNRSHKNDTSCNFWPKLLAVARHFSQFPTFSRRCPPSFFTSPCFSCHFLYFPVLSCIYNCIELGKVTSSSAFCMYWVSQCHESC